MRLLLILPALTTAVLVAGCDRLSDLGRSSEDRINSAIALPDELLMARDSMLAAVSGAEYQQFSNEFAARLRVRAISCSKGFRPGWNERRADIAAHFADRSCFADADAQLTRWIRNTRLAKALAQPPLRPIPSNPPKYISSVSHIYKASFAADAGIAALQGGQELSIVEIDTNRVVYSEPRPPSGSRLLLLSPNGRVFAAGDGNLLTIRLSDTGETVMAIAGVRGFRWLNSRFGLLLMSNASGAKLIEFASGAQIDVPGVRDHITLALPGGSEEFVLVGLNGTYRMSATAEGQRPTIRLIDEESGPGIHSSDELGDYDAAAGIYVDGGRKLRLMSIPSGHVREVVLDPLQPRAALPTGRRGEYLIRAAIPPPTANGETTRHFVYSSNDETLAEVNLPMQPGERYVYLTPLRKIAAIKDARITVLSELPAAAPRPLGEALATFQEVVNRNKLVEFDRTAAARSPPLEKIEGPPWLSTIVKDYQSARVEAVGVYQSNSGPVEIRVRRQPTPLVLVLSSFLPVRWMIVAESDAKIAAVLLGGHQPSAVVGAGNTRVVNIGKAYAYNRNSQDFRNLEAEVMRWTGKPIDVFQGVHRGAAFMVGR